jgi:TolB protein
MSTGVTSRRGLVFSATALLAGATLAWSGAGMAQQPSAAPRQRIVKIALPEFNAESGDAADLARQVTALIVDDLRGAGHLTLIDSAGLPAVAVDSVPPFAAWRALGVEGLVVGGIRTVADGRLRAEFRVWDVAAGLMLVGQQYFTVPDHWQQLAHVIAGSVYERLIGEARDFEAHHDERRG